MNYSNPNRRKFLQKSAGMVAAGVVAPCIFSTGDLLANSSMALVVNLDYVNGVTTTVNGPGPLSVFDATTGTWSPTGQASTKLNIEPGGGVLVGLTSVVKQ